MTIIAFILGFWHNAEQAAAKADGMFGYRETFKRLDYFLAPTHKFIACGTFSDPAFNPCPDAVVVNSGELYRQPYDVFYNQYSGCAFTAAMAYALNRQDWDMLVTLDTDTLVGDVNFNTLMREFELRPEVLLTQAWGVTPGGSFNVYKREAAAMMLHRRKRANMIDPSEPKPILLEHEWAAIFRGRWWNPWPHIISMRQDHGYAHDPHPRRVIEESWPFVRLPHLAIVEEYLHTQTNKAVPLWASVT